MSDSSAETISNQYPETKSEEHSETDRKPSIRTVPRRRSAQDFKNDTTQSERDLLSKEISRAIVGFLDDDRPVYLEGFGIISFTKKTEWISRTHGSSMLVRQETARELQFEKCSELVSFQRSRFGRIVETYELCQLLYPRLSLEMQIKWSEADLRSLLRGFMQNLLKEVIISGRSQQLESLGVFYSLHNRQGNKLSDWFAGADVFLAPTYRPILKIGASRLLPRPVLESSWEIFEASYGKPLQVIKLNLAKELGDLDMRSENLPSLEIQVAVFEKPSKSGERRLLYCSDGIRRLHSSLGANQHLGHEFIVQTVSDLNMSAPGIESVPVWPTRLITLAWLLLESSKSKSVRLGAGLSLGTPLVGSQDPSLKSIFTTRYSAIGFEQLCAEGRFNYLNLIAINDDESEIARNYGAEHLLALLKYRKIDQEIRLKRPSVVAKSSLLVDNRDIN